MGRLQETIQRGLAVIGTVLLLFVSGAGAAGPGVTYHGRLLKPNGQPVDSSAVQFKVQIRTDSATDCLMYEEIHTRDLSEAAGVFSLTLGLNATSVNTEPYTLDQVFQNRGTLTFPGGKCVHTSSFALNPTSTRQIAVSFNDGSFGGWEPLPSQQINFVPTAFESVTVGGFRGGELFRVVDGSGVPQALAPWSPSSYTALTGFIGGITSSTPSNGDVLAWNASQSRWQAAPPVSGGGGGDVMSSRTLNAGTGLTGGGDLSADRTFAVNVGTGANQIPQLDGSGKLNSSVLPSSLLTSSTTAGGDLSGTYPSPLVGKIQGNTVASTSFMTAGQVYRWNGSNLAPGFVGLNDIRSTASGNANIFPTNCTASQTMLWTSPADVFSCVDVTIAWSKVTSTPTTLAGYGITDAASATNVVLKDGQNGALTAGTNDANALTLETNNSARLTIDSAGNIGVGTTTPVATEGKVVHLHNALNDGTVASNASMVIQSANRNAVLNIVTPSTGTGAINFRNTSPSTSTDQGTISYEHPAKSLILNTPSDSSLASPSTSLNAGLQVRAGSVTTVDTNLNSTLLLLQKYRVGTDAIGAIGVRNFDTSSNASSLLQFWVKDAAGSNLVNPMTLTGSGFVGIGTATPTSTLEVNGTIKATAFEGPLTASTNSVGAGSNSAPSITFTGDPDTGFYNTGSNNTISVAAGGAKIFDFTSSGLISPTTGGALLKTGNGDATTPTYSFAGDPDTGWFRPTDDTLAASTGGSEKVRITSTGYLGLGVQSPSHPLHISTLEPHVGVILAGAPTVGTTSRAILAANITANDYNAISQTGDMGLVYAGPTIDTAMGFFIAPWRSAVGTPTGLRMDGSGNVGIGTSSPQALLHLQSTGSNPLTIVQNDSAAAGLAGAWVRTRYAHGTASAPTFLSQTDFLGGLSIGTTDGTSMTPSAQATIGGVATQNHSASARGTALYFSTTENSSTGYSERMRIDHNGNVGIGTTTPTGLLTLASDATANLRMESFNSSSNSASFVLAGKGRGTKASPQPSQAGDEIGAFISRSWGTTGFTGSSGSIVYGIAAENQTDTTLGQHMGFKTTPVGSTGALERMRITSEGDVHIGASNSTLGIFSVTGNGRSGAPFFRSYWDSDGTNMGLVRYRGTATAPAALQTGDRIGAVIMSGATSATATYNSASVEAYAQENFSTTAAGTALIFGVTALGTANRFEAMRITPSGAVGFGKSAPGAKVEVGVTGNNDGLRVSGTTNALALYTNLTMSGYNVLTQAGDQALIAMGPSIDHASIGGIVIGPWSNSSRGIRIAPSGSVGIGVANPSAKLDVQGGAVNASGGYTQNSDVRLKTRIEWMEGSGALEKVLSLRGILYDWKDQEAFGPERQMGLIAQDVERVFPEAVRKNGDGFLTVSYSNLVAPVIEAIKELFLDSQELKAENREQARKIASLEEENEELRREQQEILRRLERLEKSSAPSK